MVKAAHLDADVLLRVGALTRGEVDLVGNVLHLGGRLVRIAREAFHSDVSAEGDNIRRTESAMRVRLVDVKGVDTLVRRGVPEAKRREDRGQVVVVLQTYVKIGCVS